MKPLRFLPAAAAGLLLGLGISAWLSSPPVPAAASAARPGKSAAGPLSSAAQRLEAFRALVAQRSPLPFPGFTYPGIRGVFLGSQKSPEERSRSPVRSSLEAEVQRNMLPDDAVSGNYLLDLEPEGSPGAEELLARWVSTHPLYALAELDRLLSGFRKNDEQAARLRSRLYREWVRIDARAALTESLKESSVYKKGENLSAFLIEWSRVDPAAAAASLASLPDCGPGAGLRDFTSLVLRQWNRSDATAAQAWMQNQTSPALREVLDGLNAQLSAPGTPERVEALLNAPHREPGRIASEMGFWLHADPEAAIGKLMAIPASDPFWSADASEVVKSAALFTGGRTQVELSEAAYRKYDSVPPGPQRDAILAGLVNYGVEKDLPFAVRMAAEMGDGPAAAPALTALTERWMSRDPVAVSEWLTGLPSGAGRDAAVSRFATLLSLADPESAARWAESLPENSALRASTIRAVKAQWTTTDQKAAEAWQP